MALRAGTVPQFDGSLADLIEGAFAAELYALKGEELPETGRDERRVLFAAVAQAVLVYLASNRDDLVALEGTSPGFPGIVDVRAPRLDVIGTSADYARVTARRFPVGATVTIAWEQPHASSQTSTASSSGEVSDVYMPRGGRSGTHIISARDGSGNQAVVAVQL